MFFHSKGSMKRRRLSLVLGCCFVGVLISALLIHDRNDPSVSFGLWVGVVNIGALCYYQWLVAKT